MKKILLILPLFLVITGCMNYVELNNLEIIEQIGIDYKDNNYYFLVTSIEKDDSINRKHYEINSNTLEDGIKKLNLITEKKIYLTHLKTLLITQNCFNEKISEIIEFFINDKASRNDFFLILGNDINILKEDIDINDKIKIIKQEYGSTNNITLEEMLKSFLDNRTSFIPTIILDNNDVLVDGISIVENKKIIDNLSLDESIFYNYVLNNIVNTSINNIEVTSNNTGLSYKKNNINLEISSTLYQNYNEYPNVLKNGILDLYKKYQNKNIDLFNFEYITHYKLKDIVLNIDIDYDYNSKNMGVFK